MWLFLAITIVVLGFIFGDHVNLFWLVAIIISVMYCWKKHGESKKIISAVNSNNTTWGDYVSRSVSIVADNYWKQRKAFHGTDEDIFQSLKESYVNNLEFQSKNLPASVNLLTIGAFVSAITWCKQANSMTELCEACVSIRSEGGYVYQSDDLKRFTILKINQTLALKQIPSAFILDEYNGKF